MPNRCVWTLCDSAARLFDRDASMCNFKETWAALPRCNATTSCIMHEPWPKPSYTSTSRRHLAKQANVNKCAVCHSNLFQLAFLSYRLSFRLHLLVWTISLRCYTEARQMHCCTDHFKKKEKKTYHLVQFIEFRAGKTICPYFFF